MQVRGSYDMYDAMADHDEAIEDLCRAFADGGDEPTPEGLTEVPYDDLPEGSKHWYRVRMKAALEILRR